jgi:hypothetical protein
MEVFEANVYDCNVVYMALHWLMLRLTSRHFSSKASRNVVLVDGCRIPFKLTGTDYSSHMAVDLSRYFPYSFTSSEMAYYGLVV